jgi:hypothetical protein
MAGRIVVDEVLIGGMQSLARIKSMFQRVRTVEESYQVGDTPNQTWRRALVALSNEGGGTLVPTLTDYYFTGDAPKLNGLKNVTVRALHGTVVRIHAAAGAGARTAFFFNSGGDSKNLTFEGLTFDGGMTNYATITGYARQGDVGTQNRVFSADRIETAFQIVSNRLPQNSAASRLENLTIRRCTFEGVGKDNLPMMITGSFGETVVENCEITRCLDTGFIGVEQVVFRHNRVTYSADNGVSASRGCGRVRVYDNTILYSWYSGVHAGGFDGDLAAKHSIISNNTIHGVGKNAINLDYGAYNVVCAGNDIADVRRGAADHTDATDFGNAFYIKGIDDANPAGLININGNIIDNVRGRVVNLAGYVDGVLFTGNQVGDFGSPFLVNGTSITPSADGNFSVMIGYPGPARTTPTVKNVVNRGNQIRTTQMQDNGTGTMIPVARRVSWFPNVTTWIDAGNDVQGVGVSNVYANSITAVSNVGFLNVGAADRDAEARVTFDASASSRLRGLLWKVTGLNRYGIFGDTQGALDFKAYDDAGANGVTLMQMIRTAGAQRMHFPRTLTAVSATVGAADQTNDARVEFDASGSSVLRGFFWRVGGSLRYGIFANTVSTLLFRSYSDGGASTDVAQINRALSRFEALTPMGLAQYTTAARPTAASAGAGAMILDTTLRKILTSNGTNWADQTGTVVQHSNAPT